jgi:K+/H+ antiporter YhaU regulatory subunit KhtT
MIYGALDTLFSGSSCSGTRITGDIARSRTTRKRRCGRFLHESYRRAEYQTKRQEEKEAARQAREDQREQEKLEKVIREVRAKIEKERQHFNSALKKLQLRQLLQTTN